MKICVISKYPPVEGGVSTRTYWLARALGERGHQVHVVTNAEEVEKSSRMEISPQERSLLNPTNVRLWSTNSESSRLRVIPKHNPYLAKLVNLALAVVREFDIDVIYAHYLLPYGVAGLFTKLLTGKPLVIRHAGSDLGQLFYSPYLQELFIQVFRNADCVIGYGALKEIFKKLGLPTDKIVSPSQPQNLKDFHPKVEPFKPLCPLPLQHAPVFAYIGKISKLKKTFHFIDAVSRIRDRDYNLLFVVGSGEDSRFLQKYLQEKNLLSRSLVLPYQPPWRMPSIYTFSTCVVSPESSDSPYLPPGTHHPCIPLEAMACGRGVIIGKGVKNKGVYGHFQDGKHLLVVNPEESDEFTTKLQWVTDHPDETARIGDAARKVLEDSDRWDQSLETFENLFQNVFHSPVLK